MHEVCKSSALYIVMEEAIRQILAQLNSTCNPLATSLLLPTWNVVFTCSNEVGLAPLLGVVQASRHQSFRVPVAPEDR